MWDHSAGCDLGTHEVIGAWIICLALATVFFGYPVVMAASAP